VLENQFIALAMFFWLSYVPIAFLSVFRILKNRNLFVEHDLRRIHNDPAIIFQITTRSATRTPVVRRGLKSIISSVEKVNFYNYQISIVTDDPDDARTLKNEKCEVVVVPKDFRTNAIKKGRALQYAVEHRRRIGMHTKKHWIFHMDDESYVTPQTILALLKFIREGKGVASEGPIFYPLKFESANRLTAIAESVRPFSCYDCVSQMTHPPPLHMHGSNLLIRSDIEDSIEWNFGPTLAEDQMFGFKVHEKYGQGSMGWHGGILLEQPPLNLKDHFFQRRRWVLGTMQNLQKYPRRHRYKLMFKSITYFLGFASAVASAAYSVNNYLPMLLSPSYLHYNIIAWQTKLSTLSFDSIAHSIANTSPVELGIAPIMLFTSLVWLASYQVGLFLNLRYSKIGWAKRLLYHIQALLFTPVIGLVETFPAFWAMIEYSVKKKRTAEKMPIYDFYVVSK
jgi:egghead protein (zeste-white 4 protein)